MSPLKGFHCFSEYYSFILFKSSQYTLREKPRREQKNNVVNVERQKVQKLKKGGVKKKKTVIDIICSISTVKCLKNNLTFLADIIQNVFDKVQTQRGRFIQVNNVFHLAAFRYNFWINIG